MSLSFWVSAPIAPREVMLSHLDSITSLFFFTTLSIAGVPEALAEHWRVVIGLLGIFVIIALVAFVIFVIGFEIRYNRLSRFMMANISKDREDISVLTDREAELFEALTEIKRTQDEQSQHLGHILEALKGNSNYIIGKK